MEKMGWQQPRKTGSRWTEDEITEIEQMLNEDATQLELCAALPHPSWAKIRRKITQLRGKDFKVIKPQVRMKQHETIEQYLARNPLQAVTMKFSISENWSRQKQS